LTPVTDYTYQIKATGATSAESSSYTSSANVTTTLVASGGTLTNPGNKTQSVTSGTPITDIVFTWGGDATDVTITGLPAGVTSVKNAGAKTITISGSPTATGTYTVTTTGGSGAAATQSGTITATLNPGTITNPGNKSQTIDLADPIASVIFTWGGGATDVNVTGLPAGLIATKNMGAKTVTISGTPSAVASTTDTVTTVGGTSAAVETGIITVQTALTCLELVTIPLTAVASGGTFDMILFDAAGTTQIKVLGSGVFNAGDSDFVFAKSGLSPGTYTYKLMSGATVIKTGGLVLP
jgi:hypothetical protein